MIYSRYCQSMNVSKEIEGKQGRKGLKVIFTSDKKKIGGGAQCTAQCIDPGPSTTTTTTTASDTTTGDLTCNSSISRTLPIAADNASKSQIRILNHPLTTWCNSSHLLPDAGYKLHKWWGEQCDLFCHHAWWCRVCKWVWSAVHNWAFLEKNHSWFQNCKCYPQQSIHISTLPLPLQIRATRYYGVLTGSLPTTPSRKMFLTDLSTAPFFLLVTPNISATLPIP